MTENSIENIKKRMEIDILLFGFCAAKINGDGELERVAPESIEPSEIKDKNET